ncbi:HSP70/90 co-chaperone [Emydomyces testavorans]|uniref:HSP70/90 co-chaperone n=1 Tax=Emydomyces testavorans TaxID=2070801 RepID=A0AAF0DPE0_9EURO|nr:HSP70/90 co-chaperone [Emydomyces testavorans]
MSPTRSTETPFPINHTALPSANNNDPTLSTAPALPPALASVKSHTSSSLASLLNQTPLFMTDIEQAQTDSAGDENVFLEAIRALQHEGTRAEVAGGFHETGNELAREKNWVDAREFYGKALAAIRDTAGKGDGRREDMEGDERRLREIEEKVLDPENYRSCILDCAATLKLNPHNVKAYYRSARALLALDKLPEAQDATDRGLALDPANKPLHLTAQHISARRTALDALTAKQRAQHEHTQRAKLTLATALRARGIRVRQTPQPPDLEDAAMHLSPDPLSPQSTLVVPCVLLYPLHGQSDLIKGFAETQCLRDHLEYILPVPWDEAGEYGAVEKVDCFMETVAGGLVKVGKGVSLLEVLSEGKVEIVDGLVRINVVPVGKSKMWIEEMKARRMGG